MKLYFTADTHFGHSNILRYTKRPYRTVEEMNEALCDNWASVVTDHDHIYHLGDVVFGRNFQEIATLIHMVRKLPGRKHLIPGNHDKKYLNLLSWAFQEVLPPIYDLNLKQVGKGSQLIVLAHFPLTVWNNSHRGALQFYGHVHGAFCGNQQQTDVGVDVWNYTPASFEQIFERLATLPKRMPVLDYTDWKSKHDTD